MFKRAWKPVAATVVVGAPAYYYYKTRYSAPQTFDFHMKVRGPTGKPEMSTRTFPLLPLKELEARIQENATSETVVRVDGITWKHTTANLASNDPIEDAHAAHVIGRDESDPSAPGDYLFFAVMDGHGGYETSRLLSRVLIQGVALELAKLIVDPNSSPQSGLLDRVRSLLWIAPSKSVRAPLDADPARVSKAIETAFTNLDNELLQAPLRVLANNMGSEDYKNKTIPDLSQHPLALTTMLPAISGVCLVYALSFIYLTSTNYLQAAAR